jgi:transposase-like protein
MAKRNRRTPTANANADDPQKPADARAGRKTRGHGAKTEALRERAILALLSERTIAKAARRCGVNERTLRRWMADDEEFKRELTEARRVMFQAGMNRVQALTAEAVNTLETLMGRSMPPNVRLGAARTVAELGIHQHDADAIIRKLDEIEEYQRQQDGSERR